MPTKIPPRVKAAFLRVDVAFEHLENARREIEAACIDLATVKGAPRSVSVLLNDARLTMHLLQMYAADPDSACELDHDPTPAELRRGHGPHHGCGKKGKH
jgi:hypothetical protein